MGGGGDDKFSVLKYYLNSKTEEMLKSLKGILEDQMLECPPGKRKVLGSSPVPVDIVPFGSSNFIFF